MGKHLYFQICIYIEAHYGFKCQFFLPFVQIESNHRSNLKAPLGGGSVHWFYSPINPSHPKECPAVSMLTDVNGVPELMGEVKWDQLDVTASVSTTTTTTTHTHRSQRTITTACFLSRTNSLTPWSSGQTAIFPTIWHCVALSTATTPSSRGGGCIDTWCGSECSYRLRWHMRDGSNQLCLIHHSVTRRHDQTRWASAEVPAVSSFIYESRRNINDPALQMINWMVSMPLVI